MGIQWKNPKPGANERLIAWFEVDDCLGQIWLSQDEETIFWIVQDWKNEYKARGRAATVDEAKCKLECLARTRDTTHEGWKRMNNF